MRRWFVALAALAISASLTLAALFPSTSQAQIDFTASSETSSTHACSAPVVRWNMLMRFWPQAEGDISLTGFPSAEGLRPLVEESRAEFVIYSDCVVDLTIDGLLKSGSYLPGEDNGASAYGGTYDIVWDVYGSIDFGLAECAKIALRFPAHAESTEIACIGASQAWVPWGTLLTHEWWHEATEHTLPALGVQRPLPDNHKDYGYPASYEGVVQFYREMFAGQLTPDGSIRGPSPAEWALGTNRTAYERGGGGGGGGGRNRERLRFGRVKSDRRHGTAKLTVIVPGPGTVKLKETGKVKRDTERPKKAGEAVVSIRPKPGFKKKLKASTEPLGVIAKVTYTSKSGSSLKGRKPIRLSLPG